MSSPTSSTLLSTQNLDTASTVSEVFHQYQTLIRLSLRHIQILKAQSQTLADESNTTYEDIENDIARLTNAVAQEYDVNIEYARFLDGWMDGKVVLVRMRHLISELEEGLK
ncbi:hypothetical protein HBI56_161310 [Parastagonospora nodorum]|uniref:Uncharacterized protein n=1 Tax=Phaeosphaeria nodorum (strain SN15 / ATCC MYA-4574 / FGSC 10173) TaxID=321614 RepID=A0A7U2NPT1_PHANO|nr:hypothetical protein HBH56_211400 [Parastagonospora nodorum]QRD06002.1 hypothetical protein JI435_134200 [Parastagonospora nodorum SN15]KAH3931678.1 hypothetical protein HBH54_100010 [Parastagonospora nodorum]KAH3944338.1 hypothetical protein HBH53_161480 [Parastagonospora nodorum]KAH3960731.1 hypothetical protein HBH51_189690 [Parastagonospora nodorum]